MHFAPEHFAPLLARLILGLLFLAQGYDKVFHIGVARVAETIAPAYRKFGLPQPVIGFAAGFTAWIELAGGLLLLTGWLKYLALYALGFDLLLVAFAFSILNPVWDMQAFFYRLMLLLFLLVYPAGLDTYTLAALWE